MDRLTEVLLKSGNKVAVDQDPEAVMEERSRAVKTRFPSGEGSAYMELTREGDKVLLLPDEVEGCQRVWDR